MKRALSLGIALCGCLSMSTALQASEQSFEQCKVRLANAAKDAGVNAALVDRTMLEVKPIPRTLSLDKSQPEFRETFAEYMNKRVTEWRVSEGRKMLRKHQALLQRLTAEYGIPGQYLIAFWGLETNYGSYKGKMPTINAIATLACDKRRRDFFTGEFVQAMTLAERNGFEPHELLGSWAGAVGHTQFMPSAYNAYAVDGDGDGIVDLWNSEVDALTSAANFLRSLGWRPGERWGREVVLDPNQSILPLGRGQKQALSQWRTQGVTTVQGKPMPSIDMSAGLLLPLGAKGPAFLAYDNFDVIMRWNRSESYAISVGHLADRINGAGRLSVSLESFGKLRIEDLTHIQERLNAKGYDVGKPDGRLGPKTRKGIQAYQQANGLVADGYPSDELMRQLLR